MKKTFYLIIIFLCITSQKTIKTTPHSKKLSQNKSFKQHKYLYPGLCTYYASLFKKINKEDFIYKGNNPEFQDKFLTFLSDAIRLYAMIELASNDHFKFIPNVLHIHNIENQPINSYKMQKLWLEIIELIQNTTPYTPLKNIKNKK